MLLERDGPIAAVEERISNAVAGQGAVVLIGGEAGVGKTALTECVAAWARGRRIAVTVGACDALATPRPLGPFRDIAAEIGEAPLLELMEGARRHDLLGGWLASLQRAGARVVVVEDLHWADEATLDLIRFLARRIASTRTAVIGTYRDDELTEHHPLRVLLGDLSSMPAVLRLTLQPLSPAAVASLAAGRSIDVADLYRRTGGNPFFVIEVLASSGGSVPSAVRDAVLARAARLGSGGRAVLEAAAVVPQRIELELLDVMVPGCDADVAECQRRGMLVADGRFLRFRHELARSAIESDVPPARARTLHRMVLTWLAGQRSRGIDVSRLVHHAVATSDAAAVVELAPEAARVASKLGAHRQAAAHYAAAITAGEGRLPLRELAELLDSQVEECLVTGQHVDALAPAQRGLEIWRELADTLRTGQAQWRLSRVLIHAGRGEEARRSADAAIEILAAAEPGPALARALATRSGLAMRADERADVVLWGERALELAERLGEDEVAVTTLINLGTLELEHAPTGARADRIDEAIRRARAGGFANQLGRAFTNLATVRVLRREYTAARAALDEGIPYCDEHGLDAAAAWMRAYRARLTLETGDLDGAAAIASVQLRGAVTQESRAMALLVVGTVRARRGDPGVWEALHEASRIADGLAELQFLAPAAAARLEAALLLGGDVRAEADRAMHALALSAKQATSWWVGELSVWLRRAGFEPVRAATIAEPWSLELAGDALRAANAWVALGCPYEAAMCLVWARNADDALRRDAVQRLQGIGARQASLLAARRLRMAGVARVPRGAHRTTLANPAQLTGRELEILELLCEGLTNSEIAGRSHLSAKTVDHHVGAVLSKLAARNRTAAVAEARRLGIVKGAPITRG